MVFANLTEEDKHAFFALLDEYFSSRPELADALQLGNQSRVNNVTAPNNIAAAQRAFANNPQAASAAASAAHRALANNPQATSAVASAGLRAAVPKSSPFASAAANPQVSNAVGRFAAASLAFNDGSAARSQSTEPTKEPPKDLRPSPPPRRPSNSSVGGAGSEIPPRAPPRAKPVLPNGLVTQRKLGDIDTSSGKNMLWGMRNKEAPVPAAPPPPALPSSKAKLPPPPRRGTMPKPRTPTPEPEPEQEEEPEYEGEWAEALYDYKSTDPNDLSLQAEQRVLVTERTSDDWWTGEADGKSGLFPASYVKML